MSRLLTIRQMIFFGANDACLPGNSQHVPMAQYCESLKLLCLHPSIKAHNAKVILVTPPPVNEYQLTSNDKSKGRTVRQRTAANTKDYAAECRKVGDELDLPVVDLWCAFMTKAGWKEGEPLIGSEDVERSAVLDNLLRDGMCILVLSAEADDSQGLHLGVQGYRVMYDEVMKVIHDELPDQRPEKLPTVYPPWEQAPV